MAKLWRLENEKGTGVYRCQSAINMAETKRRELYEILDRYQSAPQCPGPENDEILKWQIRAKRIKIENFVFGFESPKQLLDWFDDPGDLKDFEEHGIGIAIYLTDEIVSGEKQAMMPKNYHSPLLLERRLKVDEFLAETNS